MEGVSKSDFLFLQFPPLSFIQYQKAIRLKTTLNSERNMTGICGYFDIVGSKYLLHPLYREWLAWRKCSCSTGWKLSSLFLVLQVLHSGLHAVTRQPAALCSVVPCILQYYTAIGIIFIVLIEVVIQLLRLLLLWRYQVPARCKNDSTNRPMTRILEILI